jgi:ATP-dependent helicase/nuclease subunit A
MDRQKGNMTATAEKKANALCDWLEASPEQRLEGLGGLYSAIFTKEGVPSYQKNLDNIAPDYGEYCYRVALHIDAVKARRALVALAQWLSPALELGRAYALAWEEAKAREGLIDFDDQIAHAADLLSRADMADWIRYKLDRRFDHILVDEAQDTNAEQWRIIEALTEEFFAGEGAHGDFARTLFVVGDFKQAIFGFQGTSPENFAAARERVKSRMGGAADNADAIRGGPKAHRLMELGLERSFRTAAPVLNFVDRAIEHLGAPPLVWTPRPNRIRARTAPALSPCGGRWAGRPRTMTKMAAMKIAGSRAPNAKWRTGLRVRSNIGCFRPMVSR